MTWTGGVQSNNLYVISGNFCSGALLTRTEAIVSPEFSALAINE